MVGTLLFFCSFYDRLRFFHNSGDGLVVQSARRDQATSTRPRTRFDLFLLFCMYVSDLCLVFALCVALLDSPMRAQLRRFVSKHKKNNKKGEAKKRGAGAGAGGMPGVPSPAHRLQSLAYFKWEGKVEQKSMCSTFAKIFLGLEAK